MIKRLSIPIALLAAAALACNLPLTGSNPATQALPTATSLVEATSTLLSPTNTIPAAAATQTTSDQASATPVQPTQVSTATQPTAAAAAPVVLSDISADPPQLSVVDPLSGNTLRSFSAAGLMENAPAYVTTDALFYLDSGYKIIRRAGFDGKASELTFVNPSNDLFKGVILPSPDGKMIAWAIIAGETAESTHDQLMVANLDGSAKKILVDETANPPASWSPIAWSPDGQWLYFSSTPYGIGGYILFNGVTNVRRVPVKGGATEEILPNQSSMGDVAISPDGSVVAYIHSVIGKDPSKVTLNVEVKAVSSQKASSFQLPDGYLQAGAIVWSPDSKTFVFCAAVGDPNSEAFTLLQVDASTLAVKTLLTKDSRLLRPVTWPVAYVLWLKDSADQAWNMDITSGKLTQAGAGLTVLSNSWR